MKLSPKIELAIKILKVIRENPGITSWEIGGILEVSDYKVRKICRLFSDKIESQPGMRGGYTMCNLGVTLYEVIETLEPSWLIKEVPDPKDDEVTQHVHLVKCQYFAALHQVYVI